MPRAARVATSRSSRACTCSCENGPPNRRVTSRSPYKLHARWKSSAVHSPKRSRSVGERGISRVYPVWRRRLGGADRASTRRGCSCRLATPREHSLVIGTDTHAYRRDLPHLENAGKTYFVTFR